MKKYITILLTLASCIYTSYGQQNNVGINTTTPDPSAALHVEATDKGVLIPRLTSEQRQLISNAATGLLVFDTDTGSFWFYKESAWVDLSAPAQLTDADGDTKIQVERFPDEDIIRLSTNNLILSNT
jgi:hypothetical protein